MSSNQPDVKLLGVIPKLFIQKTLTMKTFSGNFFAFLLGITLFSSCTRPVAYFQPSAREQIKSAQTEINTTSTLAEASQLTSEEKVLTGISIDSPKLATQQLAQAKQAINQLETYVRNDSKLASNKKVAKRMTRINKLLTTTDSQLSLSTKTASAQKTTLVQRIMLKQIDKKIKNHLSPERAMVKSLLTIGLIVGVIGLILLILNVASPLGVIALVVGLALVLVDLLR